MGICYVMTIVTDTVDVEHPRKGKIGIIHTK